MFYIDPSFLDKEFQIQGAGRIQSQTYFQMTFLFCRKRGGKVLCKAAVLHFGSLSANMVDHIIVNIWQTNCLLQKFSLV